MRPFPLRLLLPAAALLFAAGARADLFSPGPLVKAHAGLEGLSNCSKCHVSAGDEAHFEQKCLACHVELASRVAKGVGFHGRLSEEKRDCKICHSEHQGLEAQLIEWIPSEKAFPHAQTGWPLKGKHETVGCGDCHTQKLVAARDILRWLDAHPAQPQTFLGLSTSCKTCHFDEHRGQLDDHCEKCHVEKGWTPAPGFDHQKTDYPLTGKHREVSCAKCHAAVADTTTPKSAFPAPVKLQFEKFSDVDHASCLACHQDAHQGKFGQDCASCHSTAGWSSIHSAETQRAFHDRTRYPLRGKHAEVECKSCHGPFPGQPAEFKNLAFQSCTSCHVDAHEGQLVDARTHETKCESCHTVAGFLPARFEVAEHQKTRYPLEGAHQATPCSACHVESRALAERIPTAVTQKLHREGREVRLDLATFHFGEALSQCETCHRDPHAGQFLRTGETLACATCHQVSAFQDLKFDHARDSRFPLSGAHATAQCAACHRPQKTAKVATVQYRPLDRSCASCHADVHAGQFVSKDDPRRPEDCSTCHDTKSFTPATLFVHAAPFTRFVLDGRHASLKCATCHQPVSTRTLAVTRYLGTPTTCAGCHQDFHHGTFRQFVQ